MTFPQPYLNDPGLPDKPRIIFIPLTEIIHQYLLDFWFQEIPQNEGKQAWETENRKCIYSGFPEIPKNEGKQAWEIIHELLYDRGIPVKPSIDDYLEWEIIYQELYDGIVSENRRMYGYMDWKERIQTIRDRLNASRSKSPKDIEMEIHGRKSKTHQKPILSDTCGDDHNEEKNIQTPCDRLKASRSKTPEDIEMEIHGRKSETHQKPILSETCSDGHNEGEIQTNNNGMLAWRSKIQEDHEMEIHGRKTETYQNPIHCDKWSEVPEKQTIHLLDDLYFSSPVTPCMIPSVVKDESTVQNRNRADRSQMVTDTSEVLDTHLTKEDVDSKVPQNNWREKMFNLRWKHLSVHQVIVVLLLMTSFTQGISSHCDTSRTMNCTQLFLTCSFDTDIIRLAKNFYMNHLQDNSVDLEIIVVCQRSSKGFNCETTPTYEFVSVESNRLTVKIPEVNLEHVGKYWCNVHGFADIDQKVCQLSVTDTSSEDCFQQVNGPSDKDDRFSPAIIAIIVLGPLLVLVATSIIFICFISSGSAKYIATCFNFENCKSGRYAPTTITEEECEKM